MKKITQLLILCALAGVLLGTSGCAGPNTYRYGKRYVSHGPLVGSPEWISYVDQRVDTRYANGQRPDPGSAEWYAIVDHVVFADYSRDYHRSYGRDQFSYPDRNYYPLDQYGDSERRYTIDRGPAGARRYAGSRPNENDSSYADSDRSSSSVRASDKNFRPIDTRREKARFFERCRPIEDRPRYCVGSMEWKRAVDAALAVGHVPPPPPRSDPWDAPLAPTH